MELSLIALGHLLLSAKTEEPFFRDWKSLCKEFLWRRASALSLPFAVAFGHAAGTVAADQALACEPQKQQCARVATLVVGGLCTEVDLLAEHCFQSVIDLHIDSYRTAHEAKVNVLLGMLTKAWQLKSLVSFPLLGMYHSHL